MIRVYLPDTFLRDARDGMDSHRADAERKAVVTAEMAAILGAIDKIDTAPRARRGGGAGVWVDLTPDEARFVLGEAEYRRQYWLTDAYGPDDIQPYERTAGKAAQRVENFLREALR